MSPERFELHLQENMNKRGKHLKNTEEIKPLSFPGWSDWDEGGVEKKS